MLAQISNLVMPCLDLDVAATSDTLYLVILLIEYVAITVYMVMPKQSKYYFRCILARRRLLDNTVFLRQFKKNIVKPT